MRILPLLLTMLSVGAWAQVPDSRYSPNIEQTYENHCSVCSSSYRGEICAAAEAFDVDKRDLVYVLNRQAYFYDRDITEFVQNLLVSKTTYYSKSKLSAQEVLDRYRDERRDNISYIRAHESLPKFESKNSFDSRIYASIGPAQLQIVRALDLYDEVSPYVEADFSLEGVSKSLLGTRNAIYYMAAELADHQRLYLDLAGIDIRGNSEVQWELHNMGRAKERAYHRRIKQNRSGITQTSSHVRQRLGEWVREICP